MNSINFCDNKAFPLRKMKLGAPVPYLFWGHILSSVDYVQPLWAKYRKNYSDINFSFYK